MSRRIGYKGKAYWGAAGNDPGTEITTIVSVTPDEAASKIPQNDRANPDRNLNLRGRKNGNLDIVLNYDDADPDGFLAVLHARFDATDPDQQLIALKFLSHAAGKGYRADYRVFNVSRPEPADGLMTVTVNCEIWGNYQRI